MSPESDLRSHQGLRAAESDSACFASLSNYHFNLCTPCFPPTATGRQRGWPPVMELPLGAWSQKSGVRGSSARRDCLAESYADGSALNEAAVCWSLRFAPGARE